MRTLAVVNQKGGCGKTTTAINLSGVLASKGYRTLLVDMDPQGHCAAGLAIPEQRIDLQIGDAMLADPTDPVDPARLLWRVMRNLDLAPATLRLAALEASRGELANLTNPEHRLRGVLKNFESQYDLCVIDCSPAVGMLAFNAMVAASEVIIPVETGFFSLQGATKQVNAIKSLGKRLGVAPVHRLLATMHDPSSALSQDLLEELRRRFGARVLSTVIRFDHALREAASFGQPVIEYSPDSTGSADYQALAELLIKDAGKLKPEPGDEAPEPVQPRITVVPATVTGVGDAGLAYAQAAMPVAVQSSSTTTTAPSTLPGVPSSPLTMSRQLDMVMRARKLHAGGSVPAPAMSSSGGGTAVLATAVLTEVKPITDLFAPPAQHHPAPPSQTAPATPATIRPIDHAKPAATASVQAPVPAPTAFGVTVLEDGLLFCQPLNAGMSVAVAGEFNAWDPGRGEFKLNAMGTALELRLPCPPGMFQYRLVIDGQWMPDPYNPAVSANPFGGSNSLAVVPRRQSVKPALTPAISPQNSVSSGGFAR